MPIITFNYPDTSYSVWLNMNIDNELLGELIKKSLMTRRVIKKPLKDFVVKSDCSSCHPKHIPLPD